MAYRGLFVCNFDHNHGHAVSHFHPSHTAEEGNDEWWERCAEFALADGLHNSNRDCVYFVTPPPKRYHVVAMFQQIKPSDLPQGHAEASTTTRSRIQKCLCVLSTTPDYRRILRAALPFSDRYFHPSSYGDAAILDQLHHCLLQLSRESTPPPPPPSTPPPSHDISPLGLLLLQLGTVALRVMHVLCAGGVVCVYGLPVLGCCEAVLRLSRLSRAWSGLSTRDMDEVLDVQPSIPITEVESFLDGRVRALADAEAGTRAQALVFGISNQLFVEHPHESIDVACDLTTGRVRVFSKRFSHPCTPAESNLMECVLRQVSECAVSDEWVYQQLRMFVLSTGVCVPCCQKEEGPGCTEEWEIVDNEFEDL